MTKILYVERKRFDSFSIERAFRDIAAALPAGLSAEFQQLPCGNKFSDTLRNLFSFKNRPADIYHITGQVHYIALRFSRANTVLSIMDVRFLYREPGLRRWLLKKLYLDWPVARLDVITAISEETKREIVRYTGCDPAKVHVLDLPLTPSGRKPSNTPFNVAEPVILQVGTMENKNLPNLARAISGLNCRLRIIGRLSDEQRRTLEENSIRYENLTDLSEKQVWDEYENADLVTFCSLYEGFGLPIIEAQSLGKPVVTSDRSPMTETAGPGGAVFVDPADPENIREGIDRLIADGELRTRLRAAGLLNVRRFIPERVAESYAHLYRALLDRQ
jgi:glycosyltransferase involved in cell wall biosynthesis